MENRFVDLNGFICTILEFKDNITVSKDRTFRISFICTILEFK